SLAVLDNNLYAGGIFSKIDSVTNATSIARFDGDDWDAFSNMEAHDFYTAQVNHMEVFNDELYVGGFFHRKQGNKKYELITIEGNDLDYDESTPFSTIERFQAGAGELMAFGADEDQEKIIYSLKNGSWIPRIKGFPNINSATFSDAEYFNNEFWLAGKVDIGGGNYNHLIKWKDTSWTVIDPLDLDNAWFLKVFDNRLFAAGGFDNYNEAPVLRIAEYDDDLGIITGKVWLDANNNCVWDAGEKPLAGQVIKTGNGITLTNSNGIYNFVVPKTATYQISVHLAKYWSLSSCNTAGYQLSFGSETVIDSADFALRVDATIEDVAIKILPNAGSQPRKNFTELYTLNYINYGGKTISSGKIKLKLDDSLTNFSANPAPTQLIGNIAEWNFFDLETGDMRTIEFSAKMPVTETSSIVLLAEATSLNDAFNGDNFDSLEQSISGDTSLKGKYIFPQPAASDSVAKITVQDNLDVEYLIRFENKTAYTINTVVVIDTIDLNLAIEYIQEMGSSHPYSTRVVNCPPQLGKGVLIWTFENINLLPNISNSNDFIANRGHIRFKIQLSPTTPMGTLVKNHAHVLYDYEFSNKTNTVFCTLDMVKAVNEIVTAGGVLYPNPASANSVTVELSEEDNYTLEITDIQGRTCTPLVFFTGKSIDADISSLSPGIYFVTVSSDETTARFKLVRE
ncbi:MAG TPA: T9SS type A sorting domain-containing protein, partial [Bacteroidia bacterium]|nr:T9SS type A sorting domain-containing protein [Bacteroidia bacterium]